MIRTHRGHRVLEDQGESRADGRPTVGDDRLLERLRAAAAAEASRGGCDALEPAGSGERKEEEAVGQVREATQ